METIKEKPVLDLDLLDSNRTIYHSAERAEGASGFGRVRDVLSAVVLTDTLDVVCAELI